MAGLVIDTSVWIDVLNGRGPARVEQAVADGVVIVPPIVVAELLSGVEAPLQAVGELLQDAPMHEASLDHWIRVGELRRTLARHGVTVTIPDAHIAQCALDRDAVLLTRDAIFKQIAQHVPLRLEPS